MDTSDLSNNAARPPGTGAGTAWSGLPLPLRECGEITVLRLSSALSDALIQASEQLFKEATEALTPHEREAFVEAAEFARNHRRGITYDFMKHFELRYLRSCQRKSSNLLGHFIDFDTKELKVVEHHVLDDSLEPGKITEAIQNSCWKTLQMLTSQFRDLLNDNDLLPNDIPLGPKVIEAAVSDAIRDQPARHKAKQRLAHALRWPLAARVNLLYRDLVDHLSARDLKSFAVDNTPPATAPAAISTAPATSPAAKPTSIPKVSAVPAPAKPAPVQEEAPASPKQKAPEAPAPIPATTDDSIAEMELSAEANASTAAWDEVARCMEDPGLPRIVAEFLSNHWRRLLALIHLHYGPDSTAWRDAVRTMDELAWCLTAKSTQEDCMRLTEGMPYLLQSLNDGMEALKLPQEVRNALLVFLSKRHAEVVKASMAQASLAAAQTLTSQAPQQVAAPPAPSTPTVQEKAPETWLAGLKVGTWLTFQAPDGEAKELKLAWVSPQRSLFLLTNKQGERALSLSAADFVKRLKEGEVQIIQSPHNAPADASAERGHSIQKTA